MPQSPTAKRGLTLRKSVMQSRYEKQRSLPSEKKREQGRLSNLTGRQGEWLVSTMFSRWGWLPRDISGDFDQGLDLFVEVGHNGSGLGFHFGASVKASNGKTVVSDTGIGRDLDAHNVEYLQRQDRVVFMLFAKLQHNLIYWVDLKQALAVGQPNRSGGIRITIPSENVLHPDADAATLAREREEYLGALEKANIAWHIPRFEAIAATIAEQERALAHLDARCDVKIFPSSAGTRYEVRAREPIEVQASMRMTSHVDAEKLSESIRFGTSNYISVESFALTGSPVFERLHSPGAKGKLTLSTKPAFSLAFLLGPAWHRGSKKPDFLRLSGEFTRGNHGAQGTIRSLEHPLGVRLRVDGVAQRIGFSFETNLDSWSGRSILPMLGLLRAANVLDEMAKSASIELRLLPEVADPIFQREISPEHVSNLRLTAAYLRALDDLREVALPYVHDVVIGPDTDWSVEELHWWQIGRQLLQGENVEIPARNLNFSFTRIEGVESALVDGWASSFVLAPTSLEISAFGTTICEIPIDLCVLGYSAEFIEQPAGVMEARLTRQLDSSFRARRASSESLEDFVKESRAKVSK